MFDRRFILQITDRPGVLARIVTLCQQRCCEVTALAFRAGDRHRAAELMVTVRASAWHGDRLAAWLAGLVDVVEVQDARTGRRHGTDRGETPDPSQPLREGGSDQLNIGAGRGTRP